MCEGKLLKEGVEAVTQLAGCEGLPSQGAAGDHVEQGQVGSQLLISGGNASLDLLGVRVYGQQPRSEYV